MLIPSEFSGGFFSCQLINLQRPSAGYTLLFLIVHLGPLLPLMFLWYQISMFINDNIEFAVVFLFGESNNNTTEKLLCYKCFQSLASILGPDLLTIHTEISLDKTLLFALLFVYFLFFPPWIYSV